MKIINRIKKFFEKDVIVNNSLFIMHPYKLHDIWVFDDERVGLFQEAFVGGATEYLNILTNNALSCTVIFSSTYMPYDDVIEMDHIRTISKETGTYYYSKKYNHTLWLCRALFLYFKESPTHLYIKIKKD